MRQHLEKELNAEKVDKRVARGETLEDSKRSREEEIRDFVTRLEAVELRARPAVGGQLPDEFKAHLLMNSQRLVGSFDKHISNCLCAQD